MSLAMKLKRITVENARSFLEKQELRLDGGISIIIGPNGGGKTNLLDTVIVSLRRHLFASQYPVQVQGGNGQDYQYEFRYNDQLNQLNLEPHTDAQGKSQIIEVEVEITQPDLENMASMQADAEKLSELATRRYRNATLKGALNWKLQDFSVGTSVIYRIENNSLSHDGSTQAAHFLEYLRLYEMDGRIREDFRFAQLSLPILYLPVNRAASGFQGSVELAGYNEFETKRSLDATSSRSGSQVVSLAIGRLAQKFRLLLEEDKGQAEFGFRSDHNIEQLTEILKDLGYEWRLESINPLRNQYDIRLSKQGTSFLVGAASSGERELLTYLFAIFGLNVRDALVVVDEPELHLHPKWQRTLLNLFARLSKSTGNQFLVATHSPTFISPESIQYVSRVSSVQQRSKIQRLDSKSLPEAKHLLSIVNSQNNERLFFADAVVLVEGISDRIIFQRLLEICGKDRTSKPILEVVEVGGKGFFQAYRRLLDASHIPYSIIADRDYIEQIGTPSIKGLFKVDAREIKSDVIDNIKSLDGAALVDAIEKAITTNEWNHATEIWGYIKSRRRQLKTDLTPAETAEFDAFLSSMAQENLYLLRHGAIEEYLPVGYRGKDLDKVIKLADAPDLWDQLRMGRRDELREICDAIWERYGKPIIQTSMQPQTD